MLENWSFLIKQKYILKEVRQTSVVEMYILKPFQYTEMWKVCYVKAIDYIEEWIQLRVEFINMCTDTTSMWVCESWSDHFVLKT